jgi:integrase
MPEGELGTFQLLRRWSEWMEVSGRHAATTRYQYKRYAIAFIAETLIPLDELTEDDVVEYLATLPAKGAMRGQTIRALSSLCRFAHRHGAITSDPMAWISVPRRKYGDAEYLEPDELEQVLGAAERLDPRARPTLELMYATGARVGSLCAVTPDDVDLAKRQIRFRVTKGDKPYTNPLNDRGLQAAQRLLELRDYVAPHGPQHRRPTLVGVGPVVVQRWAKLAGELVGIKVWTHLLRHTFCERIANDPKVPEIVVVELMNWADSSQLRRYAKARGELKRLAVGQL